MAQIKTDIGYTGSRQSLTWSVSWSAEVVAYLWGGAGGGGGGDGGRFGGSGTGGGYSKRIFTIDPGDVLEITVGGGGGAGLGGRRSSGGGTAGSSLLVDSGNSFSGGRGGNAGPSGTSGGAAGGGGATVLRKNSSVIAIAGGGAGGGGAGRFGGSGTAPGPNGVFAATPGQDGGDHPVDGGGGGGGGGGAFGGQGGYWGGGSIEDPSLWNDVTGQGGYFGEGISGNDPGNEVQNPTGVAAAGSTIPFYPGQVAIGGAGSTINGANGQNGYAVFLFSSTSIYINQAGNFVPTKNVWVKATGIWQQVKTVWINRNGVWTPSTGVPALNFTQLSGQFGVSSRPGPVYVPPVMGVMGTMSDVF